MLEDCRRRFGDAFTLRLSGIGTYVLFSAPAAVKQIFTGDSAVFHAGEAGESLHPLLGRNSLLLLDDAPHMRQRRLLLPPFHGERMHAYAEIMREITDTSLDRWPLNTPFRLQTYMQDITLSVILRAVFGIEDGARMRDLGAMLTRLLDRAQSPWVLLPPFQIDLGAHSPYGDFKRLRSETDALLYAEISRRRAEGDLAKRDDILSMLLQATHEDGSPMTDEELRDELMTLLVAGHETTASTLAWVFERILSLPAVREKALAELRDVVGDGPLEPAHHGKLEYLDGIVKETLRLRPILVLVGRRLKAPVEVGGFQLPAGVNVGACIHLAHLRPESYPEPAAFKPERFIGVKPDPYAWLPFGGGVRRCIGMAFAQYEMKVVLAAILLRARMQLAPGAAVHTTRRGIILVPSGGTLVTLEERLARRIPRIPAAAPTASGAPAGSA